jgi:hypothetical protein
MSVSKGFLSGDLSGICTAAFENYLMVSVPYADPFNKHTWVLDNSVIETLNSSSPSVWNTYWTGTRPVEWATGRVQGVERIFYASADYDDNNRLWAAFQDLRLDDGCPITWTMETRGYYARLPLQDKEFRMADVFLSELEGVVDIDILAAPSSRGLYVSIGKKRIRAMKGSIRYDRLIRFDENIFALKKQSRKIRTQDFRQMPDVNKLSSCGVESDSKETIDESFQLFIVGSGEGAVRGLRLFFDPVNDILNGQCQEEEEEERGVRFDGAALKGSSDEIIETLEVPSEVFTSTKTFAAEIKGVSAVGTGEGISTISQEDADKIAQCIAESKVAHDLERTAPVTLGGLDV